MCYHLICSEPQSSSCSDVDASGGVTQEERRTGFFSLVGLEKSHCKTVHTASIQPTYHTLVEINFLLPSYSDPLNLILVRTVIAKTNKRT